jgi:hypothetical protein
MLLSTGGLTPNSRLNLPYTPIIGSNFTYHNTVCAFCCRVDTELIAKDTETNLLSVNCSCCARTSCVSETVWAYVLRRKYQRYVCFRSWVAGAWNPSILFARLCTWAGFVMNKMWEYTLDSRGLGLFLMMSFYEHDSETLRFIKCEKFIV